ncbi:uncharacterized protein LOC128954097 isoform X2 [Oppia nitens]|uniref:uncharacterized protein LOC128954097 isoform X2 n=1 Tax=Oppia nitens TaxID=1686743 RepID=UPI0023DA98CB|nr:uncharacterized protein LOC128954097 isoform X2 [Oppia nitens]
MATMSAERPAFYRPPPGYRSKPRPQSCIWSPSTANTSQAWTPSSPISYSYDTCSLPRSPNVQSGSPASDAGLRAGDILVNVGDRSTTAPPMTHSLARDIINTAGNTLNVQAQRPSGAAGAAPGGTSTGTSPMSPSRSMTPTYQTGEPSSSHTPYRPGPVGPRGYIPNYGHNDYYEISSIRKPDSNSEKFLQEKAREQWAISKQTYRTLPLIEPRPKVRRDQPMGMSYMRLMDGPSWHDVPRTIVNPNPPKLQEVMNRFGQRVQDNNPGVVHLQYNSPMNMYSNDNVANVLQPVFIDLSFLKNNTKKSTPTTRIGTPTVVHEQHIQPESPQHSPTETPDQR